MTTHDYRRERDRLAYMQGRSDALVAVVACVIALAFFVFYWHVGGAS